MAPLNDWLRQWTWGLTAATHPPRPCAPISPHPLGFMPPLYVAICIIYYNYTSTGTSDWNSPFRPPTKLRVHSRGSLGWGN